MSKHSRIAILLFMLAVLAVAGCTGADDLPFGNVAADRFLGSGPLNITGPDADDPEVAGIASDMVTGRRFDLEFQVGSERIGRHVPSQVSVSNAAAYVAACEAGLGLIQIPLYHVRRQLEEGMWAAVPVTDSGSGRREAVLVTDFADIPEDAERVLFWPRAAGGAPPTTRA